MKRCGTLQDSVAETEPLATQLYEHLCVLQRSFSEAGAQLHTRLLLLQVWLVMVVYHHSGPLQEYKIACFMMLLLVMVIFSFTLICLSPANRWSLCSRLVMTACGMCSDNTTQLSAYVWNFTNVVLVSFGAFFISHFVHSSSSVFLLFFFFLSLIFIPSLRSLGVAQSVKQTFPSSTFRHVCSS